ncbi:MAG: hypothetical protein ABI920_06830 [Casimicrobiaceae bacterium]
MVVLEDDDVPVPVVLELVAPVPVDGMLPGELVPGAAMLPVPVEDVEDDVLGVVSAGAVVADDELVAGGKGGVAVVVLLLLELGTAGGWMTVVRSSLRSQPARPTTTASAKALDSAMLDFIKKLLWCVREDVRTSDAALQPGWLASSMPLSRSPATARLPACGRGFRCNRLSASQPRATQR